MSTAAQRRSAAFEDEIRGQLAALQRRITVLELRDDQHDDARLLSAVAARLGSAAFSAGDLVELAAVDRELAAVAGDDARALGFRLRRLARCPVGPYRLRRVKRLNHGQLWELER